jgi:hypothetical protein
MLNVPLQHRAYLIAPMSLPIMPEQFDLEEPLVGCLVTHLQRGSFAAGQAVTKFPTYEHSYINSSGAGVLWEQAWWRQGSQGQEIGLEQGTATFHKIRAPSSFLQKRALFYWSLWTPSVIGQRNQAIYPRSRTPALAYAARNTSETIVRL